MSLRLRLLVAVGVAVLVALIGSDVATYSAFRAYLNGQLDTTLQAAAPPIESCLEHGGHLSLSLVDESGPGLYAEVRSPTGATLEVVRAGQERHPGVRLPAPPLTGVMAAARRLSVSPPPAGPLSDECRGATSPADGGIVASSGASPPAAALYLSTSGKRAGQPGYRLRVSLLSDRSVLVLGLALTETGNTLSHLVLIEIGVSAAALLLVLGLGVVLVRLGVRPLLEVEQTAERIMEGNLEARVPERFDPSTEMGRLTRVLNSMLGRLAEDIDERTRTEAELRRSEARMRRFLADASHELRTPIAAVSAYSELFTSGAASRPGDLGRVLAGIQAETGRMSRLVADLMLLANLDEGRPLERHPVELVSVAADAVHAASAIGEQWPIELVASDSVEVEGDAARLRQVIDNLLANVRAHTPPGTPAVVTIERRGSEALVVVADRGPGLGEAGMARAFERFFRGDSSRSRSSGGSGLGLAIVQAIVAAHGGSVEVRETEGGGATFVVRLPAAPLEEEPA